MTSSRIHTTLPGISLRRAERPDAALVLDFIHKLAAYEKLSHEVQATLGDIEDAVKAKTKQAARAADDYVHEHPWRAIGSALGFGLLVGLLIGRR